MSQRSANVVVIGGGVNGTSIAMNLARMGAGKVLLVEKGHLASGASGRSGAMVREHYLHPVLVKMAMEASDIFHNFGDVVGGDARFTQTGRLLLSPTMAVPAFPIEEHPTVIGGRTVDDPSFAFLPFTYPINAIGHPAASLPCGFSESGLPIGLHIVGRKGDEETVLAASAAFEQVRPWAHLRPPVL